MLDKFGRVDPSQWNCSLIIANDTRIAPCLALDEMSQSPMVLKPFRFKVADVFQGEVPRAGRPFIESDTRHLRTVLSAPIDRAQGYGAKFAKDVIEGAILLQSERNAFNPVLDLIEKTAWDGVPRVENLWIDTFRCDDNAYYRETATELCVGAIARLIEPGCKFDTMPIIVGPQGSGKSTFGELLSLGFFGNLSNDFHSVQKMAESMHGCWILEPPEIAGVRRSEVNDVKAIISAKSDRYRRPYATAVSEVPRRCVLIGTSNDLEVLRDRSGNRRFWLILPHMQRGECIDLAALREVVPQIWAEALVLYRQRRARTPLHLGDLDFSLKSEEAKRIALQLQSAAMEESATDAFLPVVQAWIDAPVPRSVALGDAVGGFDDDAEDGDEPMIMRGFVGALEILAAFGDDTTFQRLAGSGRAIFLAAELLAAIEGFGPKGIHRLSDGGRLRGRLRNSNTSRDKWLRARGER